MTSPPKGFDDILPAGARSANPQQGSGTPPAPSQGGSQGGQGAGQPGQAGRQGQGGSQSGQAGGPPHRRGAGGQQQPGSPGGSQQHSGGVATEPRPQSQQAGSESGTRMAGGSIGGSFPGRAPGPTRHIGPFPWLGWKQLFFPVLFVALIGISVGILTAVGHGSSPPPPTSTKPIPIIFVFSAQSGTISHHGAHVTVDMAGVTPTTLSYGGPSSLSLLEATVQSTSYVVEHWDSYQFATKVPYGAIVPSVPSSTGSATAVGIDIASINYDYSTQTLQVVGTLSGGTGAVSNLPPGFSVANFYVDTANGKTFGQGNTPCTIEPGASCAGTGGNAFIGANLAYAQLSNANMSAANLTQANLANANLSASKLANANLNEANMTNSNLAYADLTDSNFTDAILADASFYSSGAQGAIFNGANLTGANFQSAQFPNAAFSGADLSGVTSQGTNYSSANLTDANLTNANFSNSQLDSANFTDANLTNANFSNSSAKGVIWNGAFFCNTVMPDGNLANPGC